jgi:hypothetical protein
MWTCIGRHQQFGETCCPQIQDFGTEAGDSVSLRKASKRKSHITPMEAHWREDV